MIKTDSLSKIINSKRCPACGGKTRVTTTRDSYRYRECRSCKRRYRTNEIRG